MIRRGLFALTLASAVGVPYAMWNGYKVTDPVSEWFRTDAAELEDAQVSNLPDQQTALLPLGPNDVTGQIQMKHLAVNVAPDRATAPTGPVPPIAGAPVTSLADLLNWNVTRADVRRNWARVSTSLAETDLDGLRVAVVTGTTSQDLSGSLTYYFDSYGEVQRISFHGHTGDATPLVALLTEQFNLQEEPGLGEGLFVSRKWNRTPRSVCRIRNAAVMWANSPNTQLEVLLELNRPANGGTLSPTGEALIADARTPDSRRRRWFRW